MHKTCLIVSFLFLITTAVTAQKKDHLVTITTSHGTMIAVLYDETPFHKANFIKLAKEHYYDSLLFHRVIDAFMIQGGDPDSKRAKPGDRLGNGGPGYTVPAEFNPKLFHEKGALAAARLGDAQNPTKASSGSQFYIVQGKKFTKAQLETDPQKVRPALQKFMQNPANKAHIDSLNFYKRSDPRYEAYVLKLKPLMEEQQGVRLDRETPPAPELVEKYSSLGGTPHLDGGYTVFGKVIKGLEVIDKIASLPRDANDRPKADVRMTVTVEEVSKKKIEKLYGYRYPEQAKKKK